MARIPAAARLRTWIERPSSGCNSRSIPIARSEEHTSELQSQSNLVCRLLLEKKTKRDRCCARLSGHLPLVWMQLTQRRPARCLVVFNTPLDLLVGFSWFMCIYAQLLVHVFVS